MPAKIKKKDLTKALDELEQAAVAKGEDALLSADPEGGMATEGKPLSKKVAKKAVATKAAKAMPADESSDDDSSDDDSSDDDAKKADEASDDDVAKGEDEDEDSASTDEDARETKKSLRQRAEGDRELRKGMRANDFLDSMVERISETIEGIKKSFEDRLETLRDEQRSFQVRVAKALTRISEDVTVVQKGQSVVGSRLKKALAMPNMTRRENVLEADDLTQPEVGANPKPDHPLDVVSTDEMKDWLFQKSLEPNKTGVSFDVLTIFEQTRYNPRALPKHIQAAAIRELCSE